MKYKLILLCFMFVCADAWADIFSTESLVCHYRFNGMGAGKTVADLSGNENVATASGNVVLNTKSNAKVFEGFTSTTSYILCTNVVQEAESFTIIAWVRNPDLTSSSVHLIARRGGSANYPDGHGAVNTWQTWLTTDGRLAIGAVPSYNAAKIATNNVDFAGYLPTKLTWEEDVWYQVAVVCEYEKVGNVYKRHFSGYVTKRGAAAIGDPVSTLDFDGVEGWGTGQNLVIGAARFGYYKIGCPEGMFKGEMAEAAYFSRALSTDEILNDVQCFSPTFASTDDFAKFHWNLDEKGLLPTASDATGNGFDGETEGRVCGVADVNGSGCYRGFSGLGDCLFATLDENPFADWFDRANLVLWVKNPVPAGSTRALLAAAMRSDRTDLQAWRVNVETNGAVGISMEPWTSVDECSVRVVGEPYDWGHKWHLVSIRLDTPNNFPVYSNITQNVDGSSTTNWTTGSSVRIRVYVAPATEQPKDAEFKLMAEGRILKYNRALCGQANRLVFGSAPKGYYCPFTDDVLGAQGCLGEIAFSKSTWFEFDYLRSRLTRYAKDPGFVLIFR